MLSMFTAPLMALLPSGIHICINASPLDDLILGAQGGCGQYLPDLLAIRSIEDVRQHTQLLWLLPLGADCAVNPVLHHLSGPTPEGLTWVDTGHRMDQLPAHLDEQDVQALEQFWQSPRCRDYLAPRMSKISEIHRHLLQGESSEDACLVEWFGIHSPVRDCLRALQAEDAAERDASFTPNPNPNP